MADRPASAAVAGPSPADAGRGGGHDWLLEAALAAVTVVVVVGMSRLFTDTSFLRDVLGLALAAHVVAAAARRTGLSSAATALVSVACFVVTATVLLYAGTAWFVLPTPATFSTALDQLLDGWDVVNASPAPIAPMPGLVLASGAVMACCAFVADTAALRLQSAGWAIAPAASVYGFTAAVGTGDAAILHGVLACGAMGAVMVLLRLRKRRAEAWIESGPDRGLAALARTAALALVLAVAVGAFAGPALPGARAEPWVDLESFEFTDAAPWVEVPPPEPEPWADLAPAPAAGTASAEDPGDGPRVLVSPLVQVRSRLVDLSDAELFTVAVPEDQRQYWRLTSLDEFDGDTWRARARYEEASGPLAATLTPSAAGPPVVQAVTLTGLGNSYLPVAYELRRVVDDGGVPMEYEAYSGSLIKARGAALAGPARFGYVVESAVPTIGDPDRLRGSATSMLDEEFLASNTQIPDELPDRIRVEAERVTAGARSDYHRALMLQDYFRLDGGFRYDLEVHAQGIDSLEDFLFEARAGYCEQFASAFAALARSIDLPARVAVGFTWGEWDPERGADGAYVVQGRHAHAWPEVYFAGTGWIRFEPTPGRGAPGDFAVTGHVADQAGPGPDPEAGGPDQDPEEVEAPGSPDSAGPDPAGVPPGDAPTDDPEAGSGLAGPSAPSTDSDAGGSAGSRWLSGWLLVVLVLLALGSAVGSVPLLKRLQWRRHRDRLAGNPAGLVDFWWTNALAALALVQLDAKPSETPQELARRVVSVRPEADAIQELAVIATHGRYASETPPPMAIRAGVVGSLVVGACRRQASLLSRLASAVDPSPLFRGRAN